MKALQAIFVPVEFTSQWQDPRDKEFFKKRLKSAVRAEARCIKAGFTRCGVGTSTIGDIRYEIRCYQHKPTMDAFADAVLDGLKMGRINL